MGHLELQHVDDAWAEVRECLSDPSGLDSAYSGLRGHFNIVGIDYCLHSLISAELDCDTPGDRGLGRISTHIPRLGAYCRRQLKRLGTSELGELYLLLQDAMLCGYLTRALVVTDDSQVQLADPTIMYEKWVPIIYSSAGWPPESFLNALMSTTASAFQEIDDFFGTHGMPSLGTPKCGEILARYATAGADLRAVEVGNYGT